VSQKKQKQHQGQRRSGARSAAPGQAAGPSGQSGSAPLKHPRLSVDQVRQDLRSSGQQEGSPGMLVIAALAAALFMFFYLHIVALPQMSALSGGLPMPDHRFFYSAADLAELDAAMDDPAHGQLNWVHKTAGVIFPVFVAIAVSAVAAWCLPRGAGRWITYIAAVVFAVVDIVENVLIESALNAGGEGAALASAFTTTSWVLLVVLALWVVVMLGAKIRRSLAERKARLAAGTRTRR
jgi:hypothetical protein